MAREIIWTKEKIASALVLYVKQNGKLPTSPEMDKSPFLPSSRQVQRKFGGVVNLRKDLGYVDVDFGKGNFRSAIAKSTGMRGIEAERFLYISLSNLFGELYVHTERFYGSGKKRVDFMVFTKSGNFAVDIFTTETIQNLQKNINIKVDTYKDFPESTVLYFAVQSNTLSVKDIENAQKYMTKIKQLSQLRVITISKLLEEVSLLKPLDLPAGYIPVIQ